MDTNEIGNYLVQSIPMVLYHVPRTLSIICHHLLVPSVSLFSQYFWSSPCWNHGVPCEATQGEWPVLSVFLLLQSERPTGNHPLSGQHHPHGCAGAQPAHAPRSGAGHQVHRAGGEWEVLFSVPSNIQIQQLPSYVNHSPPTSFLSSHPRMNWTLQRTTERPCLLCQQRKNGGSTVVRNW